MEARRRENFQNFLKRLVRNKLGMVGLAIIIIMIILAIIAPWITKYEYDAMDLSNAYMTPCWEHPFGTDELGRDILSRVLYGGRYSLRIGLVSIVAAGIFGTIIGAIAGYNGKMSDMIIMRLMDVIQAIPSMILSIAIAAVLGPGLTNCMIALACGMLPVYARLARASILGIRNMEYLEAATSINASKARIIFKHILPNILSPLIVEATMGVGVTILVASSLSFIGLGVRPPIPEWGAMLAAGRNYIRNYPHLTIFPGLAIIVTVLALNLFGDALRDALDPKLKN